MDKKQESLNDKVLRIALATARRHTGNERLTAVDEVDSETAMAIGSALAEAFNVEIPGDSSQEMGDSAIQDWVGYMELLVAEE